MLTYQEVLAVKTAETQAAVLPQIPGGQMTVNSIASELLRLTQKHHSISPISEGSGVRATVVSRLVHKGIAPADMDEWRMITRWLETYLKDEQRNH